MQYTIQYNNMKQFSVKQCYIQYTRWWDPTRGGCPDMPLWVIGVLVPCWLVYPLVQRLVVRCEALGGAVSRPRRAWPHRVGPRHHPDDEHLGVSRWPPLFCPAQLLLLLAALPNGRIYVGRCRLRARLASGTAGAGNHSSGGGAAAGRGAAGAIKEERDGGITCWLQRTGCVGRRCAAAGGRYRRSSSASRRRPSGAHRVQL